ncbi:unnamed protein product [Fraxinus pennsylvanica]|uniref:Ribosomal protein S1 n=1 Tax=Fraxinus pennsylvanica TaxID=56036 RepID=A0AAD1ZSM5_9LAMI|nr:unnamed protein product [Fraxinus pennsylvanica]
MGLVSQAVNNGGGHVLGIIPIPLDVFGFISHYQLAGNTLERGSIIRASVLDVSKIERLVDLSLKLEFIDKSKGERSTVLTHKKVLDGSVLLRLWILKPSFPFPCVYISGSQMLNGSSGRGTWLSWGKALRDEPLEHQ